LFPRPHIILFKLPLSTSPSSLSVLQSGFCGEDEENNALEYAFQHTPGSLPAQSQKNVFFLKLKLNSMV
jgi:hypothetical protein